MKIGIKINKMQSKLATVKAVKFGTGMGLKEAKEFCESGDLNIFEMSYDEYNKLKKDLEECGCDFILSNAYEKRKTKILKLGLGDKEDFSKFLSEHSAIDVMSLEHNDRIEFFKKLYSKLDIKELKKIFKELDENKDW